MPWSGIGGTEIATLRMMHLTRGQFRNILFCLEDASALRDMCRSAGIETVTYTPPVPSLRHAARFYRDSQRIARQVRETGADIAHFADLKAAYHNSFAAVLAKVRRVSHFRVTYTRVARRERLTLKPIQSFIFVSQEAMASFPVSLPEGSKRVVYDSIELPGPNAIAGNEDMRRELGVPPECVLVGMVARVSPQKDYFTLADAALEVLRKHPNTRFLVVGDNSRVDLNREHYHEVRKKLADLKIEDKFIFTGERNDVPRLLAAIDISVLSTHREGFPLAILESMAMRKPMVATAVGGIPEIVFPGITGYLHREGDSTELAAALLSLIEDPEAARRIGESAYEHVRSNFSRNKFVDEISQAYADVMQQPPAPMRGPA